MREIEIGMGLARAHRVTYVGELGWELYVSADQTAHVFEALEEAGADLGLKLCGLHTLDSLPDRERPIATGAMTSPTRTMCWKPGLGFTVSHQEARLHRPRRRAAEKGCRS